MNRCSRVVRGSVRSSGLKRLFSRINCPETGRSHSTAAPPAPDPDTADKPRLRAIDLARKIQQERSQQEKIQQGKIQQGKIQPNPSEAPMSGQQRTLTELKRYTQQLQHVHPNVLAKHLHRSVLHQDQHIVVINKPYGVPVREDSGGTSISSVLPVLAKIMDGMKIKSDSQLLPSLGLEKDSTGTLLLARSEEAVEHILNLNRNNQVHWKYWVILVGVPVPLEGLIDIPIIEREVTGPRPHYKMALSPAFKVNEAGDGVTKVRNHRQAQPATTKYRVLDSSSGCSLVELQPLTGAKHQMRVHMAFALGCPILGDHKYSHWSKLAPQKLPERVLGKLGLEQTKVRNLPIYLHARQITLPGRSQEVVSVSCPLPKYFTQTLKKLYLSPPDGKDNK